MGYIIGVIPLAFDWMREPLNAVGVSVEPAPIEPIQIAGYEIKQEASGEHVGWENSKIGETTWSMLVCILIAASCRRIAAYNVGPC